MGNKRADKRLPGLLIAGLGAHLAADGKELADKPSEVAVYQIGVDMQGARVGAGRWLAGWVAHKA